MKRIGLLSDTHGQIHPRVFDFFANCDEIWHAGDIGSPDVTDKLTGFKTLRAVYGNIDGHEIRGRHPLVQSFSCEELKVCMIHIGGYPGRYEKMAKELIRMEKPGLFISGHSHILKVIYDQANSLLHINPGSAGLYGIHRVITFVRFEVEGNDIRNLEIFEAERKASYQ